MESDLKSPTGRVMNDGVARISRGLAKRIADHLGLEDTPSGFQGRIGSAKGFWIRDIGDSNDETWIETYPSQRKFECDFQDAAHRTFEVKSHAKNLRSASLNTQIIPIIEDRVTDKVKVRETMARLLRKTLQENLLEQLSAMDHPTEFRHWVYKNTKARVDRQIYGYAPFLAGLPDRDEEALNFLLDGGFDPKKQQYLQDLAIKLSTDKCEVLKDKLKIEVGRSTYAYMAADFWGSWKKARSILAFQQSSRPMDSPRFSCTAWTFWSLEYQRTFPAISSVSKPCSDRNYPL